MQVSLIVAMAENHAIGVNNQLPWRLSGDLKKFKEITMGHHILMGRKTYQSIGQPLPGRKTIVLSQRGIDLPEEVNVVDSFDVAYALASERVEDELIIVGGATIYSLLLEKVQKMYITKVHTKVDGDAFFPQLDWSQWQLQAREEHQQDKKNQYPWTFEIWSR